MKRNRTIAIVWLLLCVAIPALAQQKQPEFLQTIPVSSATAIAADQKGIVYLLNPRRNLVQLDSLGRLLTVYSPQTILGRNTTIDAGNPLKLLLFNQDRQELLLLDRFLRPISSALLPEFGLNGTVRAAALASDDGFWLFNETDFTLGKLDMRMRKVVFETPLSLVLDHNRFDVRMIREYQNQVYLLDYNAGIYVFDNLGNYKQKLPLSEVAYIGFLGNELYYVKDGSLHFYDLYKQQQRTISLPKDKKYTTALATDNRLYLFAGKTADVYSW
ncbi:hypothetical protein [Pontibacter sp. Tf4]|uniref:hypothetical protein n=1 Tax=Pontibacter sp. Tf4 TaxID=2761620 RepID=UPI001C8AD5EF|nr:hypothetical protein [Pontibacter sp. Tf4]